VAVRYTSPDSTYQGPVTLRAAARNASGGLMEARAVLQIIPGATAAASSSTALPNPHP
jgi:hypothetical protein